MNNRHTQKKWGWGKRCLNRLGYLLLMIILLPFFILFGAPAAFYIMLDDNCWKWRRLRKKKCWLYTILCILMFPFLMVINVCIVWPLAVILLIPFIIFLIYHYCKERRDNRKKTKRFLDMKFGKDPKNNLTKLY
jgi:predicted membrane protein